MFWKLALAILASPFWVAQVAAQEQCALVEELISIAQRENTGVQSNTVQPPVASPRPAIPANSSQRVSGGAGTWPLSLPQLEMLLTVRNRLAKWAKIAPPRLKVCTGMGLNAMALPAGPSGIVAFTDEMLELLKFDRDAIAFVMGHEFAHLLRSHSRQRAQVNRNAVDVSIAAGVQYEQQSGRRGVAILAAIQNYRAETAAYSRDFEREADDTGFQLMHLSGFDPAGAIRATKLLLISAGNSPTGFFDNHPGWEDRLTRLEPLVRMEQARRKKIETATAQEATNGNFSQEVDRLFDAHLWREANTLVGDWLRQMPESGVAWYYRGRILSRSKSTRRQSIDAFEKAVTYDPLNRDAWYALCTRLVEQGHRREGVYCARDMQGTGRYDEVRVDTFQEKLFSHGQGLRPQSSLWMTKDANGSTFITNDIGTLTNRGLTPETVPPFRQIPAR